MTDSWRLKLRRAEQHLSELHSLIELPLVDRYDCPVTERLKSNGELEYALSLGLTFHEDIPVIAGDILFNVRSALDHMLCALIPGQEKGHAQFPIFTEDPFAVEPTTGRYRHPNTRSAWMRDTKRVPSNAVAVLTSLQPFEKARQAGKPPEDAIHHALAVLKTLQNADKHRQLIFSKPTLKRARIFLDGIEMAGAAPSLKDGAVVAVMDHKVDVQVDGVVAIPFGIGNNLGYEFPLVFNMILDSVANDVLPALEPLLP